MGDNRLTIDASGRLPLVPLGDDPSDAPGLVQKRRAQQQDVAVLFDKVPLFEPPLAIAKPAKAQELVLGFDSLAKTDAPAKRAVRSTPAPALDPSHYSPELLRHNLVATRLQLNALAPDDLRRAQLEQRLQALEAYDACKAAKPTLVPASQLPREPYSPEQLTSCTDKSGGCLPFDEAVAIEEKHREVCAWTGVDPLRFEDVASGQAAAGVDRQSRELAEQANWLHVIDAETQNPLAAAAAAYSIAHGDRVGTTAAWTDLAQAVGAVAASIAGAGQKMPDFDTTEPTRLEPEPTAGLRPATSPQRYSEEEAFKSDQLAAHRSPAEIRAISEFFRANSVPSRFWGPTMKGFAPGARVEVLATDTVVVRYYGGRAGPRSFWLTERPLLDPRADLALPKENDASGVKFWVIPRGTAVLRGTAAALNGQPGGASQIYVPDPTTLRDP
jgi:hypothetical protein